MPHSGDGTGWNETLPLNTEPRRDGALEIRDLRKGVRIRVAKEHETLAAAQAGGEHKEGSAKAYYRSANPKPTARPDGTVFDVTDKGRLLMFEDNSIWGYDGTTWKRIGFLSPNSALMKEGQVSWDGASNTYGSFSTVGFSFTVLILCVETTGNEAVDYTCIINTTPGSDEEHTINPDDAGRTTFVVNADQSGGDSRIRVKWTSVNPSGLGYDKFRYIALGIA